ncbi:MAG TPA: hypothetical protein VJ372_19755, partial [Pyrinomonadaceae bacterium]|nr:hypothetical protein [Pyrinomonadaceae bacterium]
PLCYRRSLEEHKDEGPDSLSRTDESMNKLSLWTKRAGAPHSKESFEDVFSFECGAPAPLCYRRSLEEHKDEGPDSLSRTDESINKLSLWTKRHGGAALQRVIRRRVLLGVRCPAPLCYKFVRGNKGPDSLSRTDEA